MTPKILEITDNSDVNRSSVFIIQYLADDEEHEFMDPVEYEKLNIWFKTHPLSRQLKRGDVLHNVSMGDYRNDGKFIFDGENLCYPYNEPFAESACEDEPDEYGYVPKQFLAINEFPIKYWSDVIEHNFYIYANLADQQITWYPMANKQLFIGIFTPPPTHYIPNPMPHAVISDTKDIPNGAQVYTYDLNVFDDKIKSTSDIPDALASYDIDEENTLFYVNHV
jgi:hypothetical protein